MFLLNHIISSGPAVSHYNSKVLKPDWSIPLKRLPKMINLLTFQFLAHPFYNKFTKLDCTPDAYGWHFYYNLMVFILILFKLYFMTLLLPSKFEVN